jgi:hypothetical protein
MYKSILSFLFAYIILVTLHEGAHAILALIYGEFADFIIKFYGYEVVYLTPPDQRTGLHWMFISGISSLLTIAFGYFFFLKKVHFVQLQGWLIRTTVFWVVILGLIMDPLNLSVGPFIYEGDALGIELGSGIPLLWIQLFFFAVFLINRELAAQVWLPAFGVHTRHPLLMPWFRYRGVGRSAEG